MIKNSTYWKYYNHAAIPVTPPNKAVNITEIQNGNIWKVDLGGKVLFARWTTDFDCNNVSNFWYVIKDEKFDVNFLKAKRRYEINKGLKNFNVEIIDAYKYKEELYEIQIAAYSGYPQKYRPKIEKNKFFKDITNSGNIIIFGAFYKKTSQCVGFAIVSCESDDFVDFKVLRVNPEYEKYGINAALITKILLYFNSFLDTGGIISDGTRNINHETNFQDYLEKYFLFRKAYCKLHIVYNPQIKWLINILYPFRKY